MSPSALNKKLFLTVVRHGETDANKKRVLQGQSNFPLNDAGKNQALKAGIRLKDDVFHWVFSSDQIRAYQTAEIIVKENESLKNLDSPICKDSTLRERSFGVLEGSDISCFLEEAKKRGLTFREFTPEDGEPIDKVRTRVENFFQSLCSKAREDKSEEPEVRILIVTHGGWIREMIGVYADRLGCKFPDEFGKKVHQRLTPNTGIARFSWTVNETGFGEFECHGLHDADHLGENGFISTKKFFPDDDDKPTNDVSVKSQ